MSDVFCCELSLASGEAITASAAAETTRWLLLEYAKPWTAKVFKGSRMGADVDAAIKRATTSVEGARAQAIYRPRVGRVRRPWVMIADLERGSVLRLRLPSYRALLERDLAALLEGRDAAGMEAVSGPVYLVCTHGKRDRCCAKHGVGVYNALAAMEGVQAWQTSHLGGHRFAATAVSLPGGHHYGRLRAPDAAEMVEAEARGELFDPSRYRGDCRLSAQAEAAAAYLRSRVGLRTLDALRCLSVRVLAERRWEVVLEEPATGRAFTLDVQRQARAEVRRIGSCRDSALKPATAWRCEVLERG